MLSEQHPREQGLKHQDLDEALHFLDAFRATSKRTRIETPFRHNFTFSILTFRATSKRTRIETPEIVFREHIQLVFQSNIQENKD